LDEFFCPVLESDASAFDEVVRALPPRRPSADTVLWHAIYQNPRMRHDDIVRIEFDGLLKRAFSIAGNGTARNDQDRHAEKMRTRSNIALQPRYPFRAPVPPIAPRLRARALHGLRQRVRETTAFGRPVRVRNGIGRRPRCNPLIRPLPNQEWARACVRGTCALFA
jgi:hypothetical protein